MFCLYLVLYFWPNGSARWNYITFYVSCCVSYIHGSTSFTNVRPQFNEIGIMWGPHTDKSIYSLNYRVYGPPLGGPHHMLVPAPLNVHDAHCTFQEITNIWRMLFWLQVMNWELKCSKIDALQVQVCERSHQPADQITVRNCLFVVSFTAKWYLLGQTTCDRYDYWFISTLFSILEYYCYRF